jgi:hypothetical protein
MARIFISHSPADESLARRVAQELALLGADIWLDTGDLSVSTRWHNNLDFGFEVCDAMIAILPLAATTERKVISDWNTYFERKKPVVLVVDEPFDQIGLQLDPGQYVDFEVQTFEGGMRQLIETLRYHGMLPPAQAAVASGATVPAPAVRREQPAQTQQAGAQRRFPTILNAGRRPSDPSLETAAMGVPAERPRTRLLLPVAIGLLLALAVCGGALFLFISQQNQANMQATAVVETQIAMANAQATDVALATIGAATQAAVGTEVALAQQDAMQQAENERATMSAQAATAQVDASATAQAAATKDTLMSAATLGALQGTLSAQQASDRGIPPAVAPTGNRFSDQSLIYNLQREWIIGSYAVRYWADPTFTYTVLTIEGNGQPRVQVDSFAGSTVYEFTGTDITRDGNPDVGFEMSYGGATGLACSVYVFDLGPTITRMVETSSAACGARFADPDVDGIPEIIVADTTYSYQFCSGAESPLVEVVLQFDRRARIYRPQSALFPAYYRAQAEAYRAQMALDTQLQPLAVSGQMESVKCRVLGLVLPYLYGGMRNDAWASLAQYYPYADAGEFRRRIEELFNSSPFCKSA